MRFRNVLLACALFACSDDADPAQPAGPDCEGGKCDDADGNVDVEGQTFDYIVVGSGAGGGPLAANLARNGFDVLVLEAGLDVADKDEYQVPAFHGASTEADFMSWEFFVEHFSDRDMALGDEKYHKADSEPGRDFDEGGIFYPRAAALGGCTAHNAMITVGAHDSDWDKIADLFDGDPEAEGWRPNNMQRYINDAVPRWLGREFTDPGLAIGALDIKLLTIVLSAAKQFIKETRGEDEGITTRLSRLKDEFRRLMEGDINEEDSQEGVYPIAMATVDGKRSSTREFLVATARDERFNLTIKTGAFVTNAVYEACGEEWPQGECIKLAAAATSSGETPKVTGVEYLDAPHLYEADPKHTSERPTSTKAVFARREVIFAAGAYNSPQLLMLSGIGDREQLEDNDVPVVVHSPGVGKNLQDRYEVPVIHEAVDHINILGDERKPFRLIKGCDLGDPDDECLEEWEDGGDGESRGPYSSNGVAASMVLNTERRKGDNADLANTDPDILIFGVPGHFEGYEVGYSKNALNKQTDNHFSWLILEGHTHHHDGVVELRSDDPLQRPYINFKNFGDPSSLDAQLAPEHEDDLQGLVYGMKVARRMQDRANKAMIPSIDQEMREIVPGPDADTDAELREYALQNAWGHHACCTNKIGAEDDEMAVLDHRFRVRGVEGLRVVDASVFPEIPGIFIVAPLYSVSEYAADVITVDAFVDDGILERRNYAFFERKPGTQPESAEEIAKQAE